MKLKIDDYEVTIGSNLAYGSSKTLQAPQDWEYRQDGTLRIEQTSAYTRIVYRLPFTFLRDADYQALHDFFIARGGLYKPFIYEDINGDAWPVRLDSGAYDFRHTDFLRRRGELVLVTQGDMIIVPPPVSASHWVVLRDRASYNTPLSPVNDYARVANSSSSQNAIIMRARDSHRVFVYTTIWKQPKAEAVLTWWMSTYKLSWSVISNAVGLFVSDYTVPRSPRGVPLNMHFADSSDGSVYIDHPDARSIVARCGVWNPNASGSTYPVSNYRSGVRHNNSAVLYAGGIVDQTLSGNTQSRALTLRLTPTQVSLSEGSTVWATLPLSPQMAAAVAVGTYNIGCYLCSPGGWNPVNDMPALSIDTHSTNLSLPAGPKLNWQYWESL